MSARPATPSALSASAPRTGFRRARRALLMLALLLVGVEGMTVALLKGAAQQARRVTASECLRRADHRNEWHALTADYERLADERRLLLRMEARGRRFVKDDDNVEYVTPLRGSEIE